MGRRLRRRRQGIINSGRHEIYVLMERLKDLIAKNYEEKKKEQSNKLLLKNRKEVEINANGSGYTVKEGTNKGKTLAHIQLKSKEI